MAIGNGILGVNEQNYLYENNGEERDRQDLKWVAEDCTSGWPYLEQTISEIEARL